VLFTRDTQKRFLSFSTSNEAIWSGNFRDLNTCVTRMATLSSGSLIDSETVELEMKRLRKTCIELDSPPKAYRR
jgi:transcriptional regulatory protein RtcR